MPHPIILRHAHRHRRCFIATAAFGTPFAEEVRTLQEFRGTYLMPHRWGRRFVHVYNRVSPPIADYIAEHPMLRWLTRMCLRPIVLTARRFLNK